MSQRKQKKNDQCEDEMGTAGKVVLGIAVAAAGAAIGYFGGRLLDSWLSNSEEQQGAVGGTAKEKPVKKVVDSDSESDNWHDTHANGTPSANKFVDVASPAKATKPHQPVSLHECLLDYYSKYVDIPAVLMDEATRTAEKVKSVMNIHLRQMKSADLNFLKVGELTFFGSTTEGLQVIHAEAFDVMIPVKFSEDCHMKTADAHGGMAFISLQYAGDNSEVEKVCDADHHVSAQRLLTSFQNVIRRAVDALPFAVETFFDSSSVTLTHELVNHSHPKMSIHFVPAIIIDSQLFIPASSSAADTSGVEGTLWQLSYARQEKWAVDRFDSSISGHHVALKILKAVRLNHPELFGMLPSYFYKMLLFHVLEDLPDSCDWHRDAVGERFIDLLTRLKDALSEHSLPHYFEQNVNLLESFPVERCTNLAKFIEKTLGYNNIASLLKTDY